MESIHTHCKNVTTMIKKLLCDLFGWFCPEPPIPTDPPDPPTEYIKVWICSDNLWNYVTKEWTVATYGDEITCAGRGAL